MKQERSEEIKRELFKESCLRKGRFSFLCVLLRFGNTLRLTPSSAPPPLPHEENALVQEPPLQQDWTHTQAPHFYCPCLPRQGYCV